MGQKNVKAADLPRNKGLNSTEKKRNLMPNQIWGVGRGGWRGEAQKEGKDRNKSIS